MNASPATYISHRARVLAQIVEQPGIKRARIQRRFQPARAALLDQVIDDLLTAGLIELGKVEHSAAGRPGVCYWPTGRHTAQDVSGCAVSRSGPDALPTADERNAWLRLLLAADPDKVDWQAVRAIVCKASD
jgi:hypothetical protein